MSEGVEHFLPSAVSSLDVFQALRNLGWAHGWPCSEQGAGSEASRDPSQTQLLSDPMKIHVCPTGVSLMTFPSFTELFKRALEIIQWTLACSPVILESCCHHLAMQRDLQLSCEIFTHTLQRESIKGQILCSCTCRDNQRQEKGSTLKGLRKGIIFIIIFSQA